MIDGLFIGKGGKNRRRGKNENETEKRELVFKEDGQGESAVQGTQTFAFINILDLSVTHGVFVLHRICSSYKNAG